MQKIGFFGGSFNPPTYAHLEVAKTALRQLNLDKVFFVPVGNLYNKPDLIGEKHRYNMLQLSCKDEENIDVENIELNQNRNLSTIDAFKLIEKKYGDVESYYIMGADNFKKLPNWKNSQELIENYKYIVFERKDDTHKDMELEQYIKNNEVLNNNKNNFHILTLQKFDEINSGIIRNYIKQEEYSKCNEYTMPEVIEYIKNNKLYKNCNY